MVNMPKPQYITLLLILFIFRNCGGKQKTLHTTFRDLIVTQDECMSALYSKCNVI